MKKKHYALAAILLVSGCGSKSTGGDAASNEPVDMLSASDLSQSDLLGSTGDLAIDICAMISNTASLVQQTTVAQAMPTPTMGGSIAPGTYYLTDSKIYQGAPPGTTPVQLKATQVVSSAAIQSVQQVVGAANSVYSTRTYATSGTTLNLTSTCGGTGSAMLGYDATPTQYTTYNDTAKTVNVWTKQ
jgi:hypothetical protein